MVPLYITIRQTLDKPPPLPNKSPLHWIAPLTWSFLTVLSPLTEKWSDLLTMKRQWTYGPTLLPWFDHFHTSLACFTPL